MRTPVRILRAIAQDTPGVCREPTQRDQHRRTAILTAATRMMAERGPHTVTLTDIAAAISMPRGTIRYLFPDLDNLLATIIKDHLLQVAAALGDARRATPTCTPTDIRGAYLSATRNGMGAPLPAQILAASYRHLLPEDELTAINDIRDAILAVIGGPDAEATLEFLDNPRYTLRQVEALVAALAELPEPSWADTIPPPRPKTSRELSDEKARAFNYSPGIPEMPNLDRDAVHPANQPTISARDALPRARAGP